MTIAWKSQHSETYDSIDQFEASRRRSKGIRRRRSQEDLSVPFEERIRLLRISGVSSEEIDQAMEECEQIQKFREKSITNKNWDFFAAASESLGRKLKKASDGLRARRTNILSAA